MKSGIYKIVCLVNQKVYIGSTYDFERRFKTHKTTLKNNKHKNPHLQSAFNKYGELNFKYEILEYCEEKDLKIKEQIWMDRTECYFREKGFNNCKLADRPLGYKHTEESRKIMSEKKKGSKQSLETIEKRKNKLKGLKHTEETKQKIRESKIGNKNPRYGIKYTEEEKKIKVERLLSVPRWNKGKTKENDVLVANLSEKLKGRIAVNRIKCKLINKNSNEEWIGNSLSDLAKKCPLSISSINRLRNNKIKKKGNLVNYILEVVNDC